MSDLKNRLIIILLVFPLFIGNLFLTKIQYNFNIALIALAGAIIVLYEMDFMLRHKNIDIKFKILLAEVVILFVGISILKIFYSSNISIYLPIIISIFLFNSILFMFKDNLENSINDYLFSSFALFYSLIPMLAFYFIYRDFGNRSFYIIIFLFSIVWSSNSFAYLTGISIKNRHTIGFPISPNKSWEGYIGALILGTIIPFLLWKFWLIDYINVNSYLIIIIILFLNIGTMIGDLIESFIKRSSGVKDSSNLMKGHGGIVDMIDSILFTLPLYYFISILLFK